MKIKMKSCSAGPDGVRNIGQVLDVGDDEGKRLCEGGYADPIAQPAEAVREKAVNPAGDEKRSESADDEDTTDIKSEPAKKRGKKD